MTHHNPCNEAQAEFVKQGIVVIDGIVEPDLAGEVAGETGNFGIFYRYKPLIPEWTSAIGQIATLRNSFDPHDASIRDLLKNVRKTGEELGLDLDPRSIGHPAVQAIEIAKAGEPYECRFTSPAVAAIALEGSLKLTNLANDEAEFVLEPGQAAFFRHQETIYSLSAESPGHSKGLFIAGQTG